MTRAAKSRLQKLEGRRSPHEQRAAEHRAYVKHIDENGLWTQELEKMMANIGVDGPVPECKCEQDLLDYLTEWLIG